MGRLNVLLICDRDDWILGTIVAQLSPRLAGDFNVEVLVSQRPDFRQRLAKALPRCDVIHFLSPWEFYQYKNRIFKPCVVNLWHIVDWNSFDVHRNRIDALFTGSEQWRGWAEEHIGGELLIARMPYGLDTQAFCKAPDARGKYLAQKNLPPETLVLGFAGDVLSNRSNRKGLDRLYNLLAILGTKSNISFVVRLIGSGWHTQAIPPELAANVDLGNYISAQDLPEYYSSLDYYLCLSRVEGVPYPVLEAMSCQACVLSTPVGVVPEIVQDGVNGFLLDGGDDMQGAIRAIETTAFDLDFRRNCGASARQVIVDRFSWEHVIDARIFSEVYAGAIQHFKQRTMLERLQILANAQARTLLKP